MRYKVGIIGCFDAEAADGQSIKTRILTRELESVFGSDAIERIDTYGWKRAPFRLFGRSLRAVQTSRNVIFMTDAGGIKIFPWLLLGANVLSRHKLHYVVVGAWLVSFLEQHPIIAACLRRFDTLFVETSVMVEGLKKLGFDNVRLMPNCKPLEPLDLDQLVFCNSEPYRFCTFSRVMREKGIEDAIRAVRHTNERYGRTVCTLDIYGQIDKNQHEWFTELSAKFPEYVRYHGIIPYGKSVETLMTCHALLFPTQFYTEGVPGTVIDAYAAGIPVISSRWESFADVIDDGHTGIGYPFGERERLKEILPELIRSPERIHTMKENCLKKVECYLPEHVMDILLRELA